MQNFNPFNQEEMTLFLEGLSFLSDDYKGMVDPLSENYEKQIYISRGYKDTVIRQLVKKLSAAEIHWFYIDGINCGAAELHMSGILTLLCGIESLVKKAILESQGRYPQSFEISPFKLNRQSLIRIKKNNLFDVEVLNIKNEDFSSIPEKPYICELRNSIHHGNIFKFIQHVDLGDQQIERIFVPTMMKDTYDKVLTAALKFIWNYSHVRPCRLQ
jgi:hypothetical protein